MILRRLQRAVALGLALAVCAVRLGLMRLQGPLTLERRARWLQQAARGVLGSLGIHVEVYGRPATRGLVVSNHLSYLDIAAIAAAMPCFFISKVEVGSWPFFGWAARMGATIFVNRGSMTSAVSVAEQMTERLRLPIAVPILLFPEGTSTDGSRVQRFHSRLFEPAVTLAAPITAAAVRYTLGNGRAERELCWYDDETFVHHIWKVLAVRDFRAELRFGPTQIFTDRRQAAEATHAEVERLREKRHTQDQP